MPDIFADMDDGTLIPIEDDGHGTHRVDVDPPVAVVSVAITVEPARMLPTVRRLWENGRQAPLSVTAERRVG